MAQAKIARKDRNSRRPTTLLRIFFLALAVVCCSCNSSDTSPQDSAPPRLRVGTVRSASTVADDYRSLIMSHGPAGYWRLGEATGNVARDEVTPGHPGTYVGTYPPDSPLPILGQPGAVAGDTAAQFFMSNSTIHSPPLQSTWVEIPDALNQQPSDNKITLECWFNITPGPSNPQNMSALISKTTLNYADGYGFYVYLGQVYFYVTGYNVKIGVPVGYSSTLHHIVGTFDGSQMQLYYDGQLVGRKPWARGIAAGTAPLRIGKSVPYAGWPGIIDEVAIYDRVLSDSEIQSHYQLVHAAATGPNNSIESFALYADKNISLGMYVVTVGGATGVASPASSAFGPQLVVGPSDRIDPVRDVFAPSVSLGSKASVGGVVTNSLTNNGAQQAEQFPYPATMPRVPLALPATPGTTNVTVAKGQTQTLNPGNFGVLTDNGTVNLNPGTYSFAGIIVGNSAQLVALPGGSVDLRIAGTLSTGVAAQISTSGQPANALTISVSGSDGANGAPPAVSLGTNTTVVGIVIAPRGTISFGTRVYATGAYAAFSIVAANNVAITFQSGLPSQAQQPVGQQQLTGYVTGPSVGAPLIGPVPPSTPMGLAISLPVQTPSTFYSLSDFARHVSDPSDSMYRHYLTEDQYAGHYRPSDDSYQALVALAQSQGLTVVNQYADNELLDVTATVGQIAQALHANLNYYQRRDGTQFLALDRQPSIAQPVTTAGKPVQVLYLSGTTDFVPPTPAIDVANGNALLGLDFRDAYVGDCATELDASGHPIHLDGTGQTIGILAFEGFNPADLTNYDQAAGIADPAFGAVWYRPNGLLSLVAPVVDLFGNCLLDLCSANGKTEAPMDVELAHAMAPGAQIVFNVGPVADGGGIFHNFQADVVHGAVHPPSGFPRANQISTSWMISTDDDVRQSINAMAAMGQSFVMSSGDAGSSFGVPDDIRAYDNVTLVGGTTLLSFGVGVPPSETAWSQSNAATGGGLMVFSLSAPDGIGTPWYQQSLGSHGSQQFRNYPDVSMPAMNIETRVTSGGMSGQFMPGSGTSASAPLFAGFLALANQKAKQDGIAPIGFANPALYEIAALPGSFNDVQTGTIPRHLDAPGFIDVDSSDPNFPAAIGYDLATGLGSPTCMTLNQLAAPNPLVPVTPPAPPLSHVPQAVAVGDVNTCAMVDGSTMECWGLNHDGETGPQQFIGVNTDQHLTPVCANPPSQASPRALAAGTGHVCAILSDSSVWCWGSNDLGQLGQGAIDQETGQTLPKSAAVRMQGLPSGDAPMQIVAGGDDTCVVTASGALWCWGGNMSGLVGNGMTDGIPHSAPVRVQGLQPVIQASIAPLGGSMCALQVPGFVSCWGGGPTTYVTSLTPQVVELDGLIETPANAIFVAAGDKHACLILGGSGDSDGLWCWGGNDSGELGTGSLVPGSTDVAVKATGMPSGATVTEVACGTASTCVLLSSGLVACFGDNAFGQVGNDTFDSPVLSPVPVVNQATALYSSGRRVCAKTSVPGLTCWGLGPIGDGTTAPVARPQNILFGHCTL